VLALLWWSSSRGEVTPIDASEIASESQAVVERADGSASPAPREKPDDDAASERTEVSKLDDAAFVSIDEDGKPIVDAVRDGVVVEVREADGTPCANCVIDVNWRKGFGLYGHDRGRTERDGTFVTTVRQASFFEALTLQHPVHGELQNGAVPIASAADPRRVVYVVPRMATIRAVVRALDGSVIQGAKVEWHCFPERRSVRDTLLVVGDLTGDTDAKGELVASVPVGACDVTTALGDAKPVQVVTMRVPPDGGTIDLVALRPQDRVEATIELVLPFEADSNLHLNTWGNSPLPMPKSPLVIAVDAKQRDYEAQQVDALHYTVRVDPLPWLASVRHGSNYYPRAEVAAGQRNVRIVCDTPMVLEPPRKALVHVMVIEPSGEPHPGANVRVHETPDLVYGSDETTDADGRITLRLPATGKKVCISARNYKLPWAVSDPITLTEGEHKVELRLQQGATVRGRVVDQDGKPLPCDVCLRRPAGGLRGLGADVGDLLASTASGDTIGTGEDGTFWFHGVGQEEHEVWAFPDRGGMPARARIRVGEEITLRQGQGCEGLTLLTIAPIDAATGKRIVVTDLDVRGALYTPRQESADAPFTCAVRSGEVMVFARAIDYVFYEQRVTVGAAPMTHEARMERSPLRFVVVRDANGGVLWPAEVRAETTSGQEVDWIDEYGNHDGSVLRTDRNGHVTLRGLSSGAYTLLIERGDPSRRESDGKPKPQRFELPAGAGLDAPFELVWRDGR
jgi:hypothetical protein